MKYKRNKKNLSIENANEESKTKAKQMNEYQQVDSKHNKRIVLS